MKLNTTIIVLVAIIFGMVSDATITAGNNAYKEHLNDKYLNGYIEQFKSSGHRITEAIELTKNKDFMNQVTKVSEEYRSFIYVTFILRIAMILLIAFLSSVAIEKLTHNKSSKRDAANCAPS